MLTFGLLETILSSTNCWPRRPKTESLLYAYDFPGNVRELENIIHRAVTLAENDIIEPHLLPPNLIPSSSSEQQFSNITEAKRCAGEKAEQEFMISCLKTTHGHISKAAKIAGIDVSNFHKAMKRYGIDPGEYK